MLIIFSHAGAIIYYAILIFSLYQHFLYWVISAYSDIVKKWGMNNIFIALKIVL
jgi:hypothetical protein